MTTIVAFTAYLPWLLVTGLILVILFLGFSWVRQINHINWLEQEMFSRVGIGNAKPIQKQIAHLEQDKALLLEEIQSLNSRNKELVEFSFTVSHDLKSPLRNSRSFLDLLEETGGSVNSSQNQAYVEYISESLNHALNLVDEILKYSVRDQPSSEPQWIPLSEVIRSIMFTQADMIKKNDVTFLIDSLPAVWGNKVNLIQLFQNLFSNAIKYNDKRFPEIRVRTEDRGDSFCFMIEDNGIGIAKAESEKIFDMFHRQKGHAQEGTGIGLSICKRIVSAMEGDIWVESMPEKGSTFFIILPAKLVSSTTNLGQDVSLTG